MQRLRVGSVAYLNALPLVEGLGDAGDLDLGFDTPARVADALARGDLDVGLVPVFEAARLRLAALPAMGVAADGEVRSVLLLSRSPLGATRVLALDPASRTSAALARLLLKRRHGLEPEVLAGPAAGSPLPAAADAALVIGDRALALAGGDLHRTDLGGAWREDTGLPFVFALWAGRDPAVLARLAPRLDAALSRGLDRLDRIAQDGAEARGLSPSVATAYLREAIHYRLGPSARAGLARFLALARTEGLLAPEAQLHLLD